VVNSAHNRRILFLGQLTIRLITPLRDDALEAELAGVREDGGAVTPMCSLFLCKRRVRSVGAKMDDPEHLLAQVVRLFAIALHARGTNPGYADSLVAEATQILLLSPSTKPSETLFSGRQ
jgi:hypothetical protein